MVWDTRKKFAYSIFHPHMCLLWQINMIRGRMMINSKWNVCVHVVMCLGACDSQLLHIVIRTFHDANGSCFLRNLHDITWFEHSMMFMVLYVTQHGNVISHLHNAYGFTYRGITTSIIPFFKCFWAHMLWHVICNLHNTTS